jgi:hypothetical protein
MISDGTRTCGRKELYTGLPVKVFGIPKAVEGRRVEVIKVFEGFYGCEMPIADLLWE